MKLLFISLTLVLLSCRNNRQEDVPLKKESQVINSKPKSVSYKQSYTDIFDPDLTGGYNLEFAASKTEQFLLLMYEGKLIDTLSSSSLGMDYKNLGYIAEDFGESFVFAQSFGSGNPHTAALIKKSTGKNLTPDFSYYIGTDTITNSLLYSESEVPVKGDSFKLINASTLKEKSFLIPMELFGEPQILGRMKLKKINSQFFIVEIEYADYSKKKEIKYRL